MIAWDDTANPLTYSGVSIVKDAPHNLLTDTAVIQCVLSENSMKGDAIGVVFSTFSGNTSVMFASGGTGFMEAFSVLGRFSDLRQVLVFNINSRD